MCDVFSLVLSVVILHACLNQYHDLFHSFLQRGMCLPCSGTSCGFMGFHADRVKPKTADDRLEFYLETGDLHPFCRK